MKATQFEFRFRLWISGAIYVLGFWSPWLRFGKSASPVSTTWLELSGDLSRWMSIETASLLITAGAIALAAAGTALRVWGMAHPARSGAANRREPVATRVDRSFGKPLSLGVLLFAPAISILMPPSGAVFFLAIGFVQLWRLNLREEAREDAGQSDASWIERTPVVEPRWMRAFAGEIFYVTMTACFAVLAWRYDARLLIQALLICFGFSLVVRAFAASRV